MSAAAQAALIVLALIGSGLVLLFPTSYFVPKVRTFVAERLIGSFVEAMMRPSRKADDEMQQAAERNKQIRGDVQSLHGYLLYCAQNPGPTGQGHLKEAELALTSLRLACPDVRDQLEAIAGLLRQPRFVVADVAPLINGLVDRLQGSCLKRADAAPVALPKGGDPSA